MRVNCPSCQEQIEIPRSTGSQPPKVPVSATVPPIPALPPRIPPHMKESTMPDSARTLIRSKPILPPPIPPQETEAKAHSDRPQPVDYGLTCDDLILYSTWASRNAWSCRLDDGKVVRCFGTRPDDRYKKGRRWFWILHDWKVQAYTVGGLAFWVLLFGILATTSKDSRLAGVVLLGVALLCLLYAILPSVALKRLRERASPALEAYWRALHKYDEEKAAAESRCTRSCPQRRTAQTLLLGVPRWLCV